MKLLTLPQDRIKQTRMENLLAWSTERRPTADTLRDLRLACDTVLSVPTFGRTFLDRVADLVPPDHPLRAPEVPTEDLAVAVLDPVRDPDRYGGALDHVEARWQQLGAWIADLGMPNDACHHLVRAVARTARDVSGEDWDSAASSGWAALQLWMEANLETGAARRRSAPVAAPGEAPVPDGPPRAAPAGGPITGGPTPEATAVPTRAGGAGAAPVGGVRLGEAARAAQRAAAAEGGERGSGSSARRDDGS